MQAWLERKRLRDIKARAAAVSALAREAHHHHHQPHTRSSLADTEAEAAARTKIFINPRDLAAEEQGEGEVEGSSSGGILVRAPVSILELQTKVSEDFTITEKAPS